jgi:hypothetical protein
MRPYILQVRTPLVPLRGRNVQSHTLLRSRTNAFCFFFWKKKNTTNPIDSQKINLLGASPQTPVVPLRGRFGKPLFFCEAEQHFCFFFWKNKNTTNLIYHNTGQFLGSQPPNRRGSASRKDSVAHTLLRSITNVFCFFFWKKKNATNPIDFKKTSLLGASPRTS